MKKLTITKMLLMVTMAALAMDNIANNNSRPTLSCQEKSNIRKQVKNNLTGKYTAAGLGFLGLGKKLFNMDARFYGENGAPIRRALKNNGVFRTTGCASLGIAGLLLSIPFGRLASYLGYNRGVKKAYEAEINKRIEEEKKAEMNSALVAYRQKKTDEQPKVVIE